MDDLSIVYLMISIYRRDANGVNNIISYFIDNTLWWYMDTNVIIQINGGIRVCAISNYYFHYKPPRDTLQRMKYVSVD